MCIIMGGLTGSTCAASWEGCLPGLHVLHGRVALGAPTMHGVVNHGVHGFPTVINPLLSLLQSRLTTCQRNQGIDRMAKMWGNGSQIDVVTLYVSSLDAACMVNLVNYRLGNDRVCSLSPKRHEDR